MEGGTPGGGNGLSQGWDLGDAQLSGEQHGGDVRW